MQQGYQVCMRCRGRKKLFRLGTTNVYSFTDSGGVLVTCPMCQGNGTVKTLQAAMLDDSTILTEIEPIENEAKSNVKGKRHKQTKEKAS